MDNIPAIFQSNNFKALAVNHQAGDDMKRIIALQGSARSGKTWSVLGYMINCCLIMPGIVCSVVRKHGRTLDTSACRDFLNIMEMYFPGQFSPDLYNKTTRTYKFANGSIIEFYGADDSSKLQGPQRDIAFLNEATEIPQESFKQITMRTSLFVILDFNPSFECYATRLKQNSNVLFLTSTYKDNPHLSPAIIQEIESYDPSNPENVKNGTADPYLHEVYALGKISRPEGAIFKFIFDCDELPPENISLYQGIGLDFGFAVGHPSACVRWRLAHNKLYTDEVFCEEGLIIRPDPHRPDRPSVVSRLEEAGITRDELIVADSARPDLIAELQMDGWNITPTKKGAGSVIFGINLLQRYQIYVTKHSMNLLRQLTNYHWRKKPDGTTVEEPEKKDDDCVDALRYGCVYELEGMMSKTTKNRIKARYGRVKRGNTSRRRLRR